MTLKNCSLFSKNFLRSSTSKAKNSLLNLSNPHSQQRSFSKGKFRKAHIGIENLGRSSLSYLVH